MERKRPPVKRSRRYDSTRRREQARQTRTAILGAAREQFLANGFAATTVAAIAEQVGVSVDTIYKTFGGKAGLVRAICEEGLAGEGPIHAEVRSDALHATESDPRAIIRGWGQLATEVAPRVAPLLLLLREAEAAEPELSGVRAEMDAQRLERMTHNARSLAAGGHLRPDLTVDAAGEIAWIYSSQELYELLVITRGWSLERFGTFIADALIAALLPPEGSRART